MRQLSAISVGLLLCLMATTAGLAFDEASIVGIWLFDDDGGDVARDSSGNGLDGTLINGAEWVDEGKVNGAIQFSFANADNVRVPLPHNDTVTVAMWASYTELPTTNIGLVHVQEGDVENADPGSKTIGIWVENTGLLWGRIIPNGGGNVNFPKNEALDAETWYHIAMVVDADAGKATQYVDGEQVGQVDYPGELTKYSFANIGRQGNESWEGLIDEVIVLSEALSPGDLKLLMGGIEESLAVQAEGKLPTFWGHTKSTVR